MANGSQLGISCADVLNLLHKKRNARRVLYAHIFIQPVSMQRETCRGIAQRPRPGQKAYRRPGLPSAPCRIPSGQRSLERCARQMLGAGCPIKQVILEHAATPDAQLACALSGLSHPKHVDWPLHCKVGYSVCSCLSYSSS